MLRVDEAGNHHHKQHHPNRTLVHPVSALQHVDSGPFYDGPPARVLQLAVTIHAAIVHHDPPVHRTRRVRDPKAAPAGPDHVTPRHATCRCIRSASRPPRRPRHSRLSEPQNPIDPMQNKTQYAIRTPAAKATSWERAFSSPFRSVVVHNCARYLMRLRGTGHSRLSAGIHGLPYGSQAAYNATEAVLFLAFCNVRTLELHAPAIGLILHRVYCWQGVVRG